MHLEDQNDAPAYETMVEALAGLKERGYTLDFNLEEDCIRCKDISKDFTPTQFNVVEIHRFEGMSNPGDNSVLYVIETNDDQKGTLVDAYGAYAQAISREMVEKLKVKH